MNSNNSGIVIRGASCFYVRAVIAGYCCFLCAGCMAGHVRTQVDLLYRHRELTGARLGSSSIRVLPLLTSRGSETGGALNFAHQEKWLRRNRRDLTISAGPVFEAGSDPETGIGARDSFYRVLFSGDVLEIKKQEEIFRAIKQDYLLVCRLKGAAHIATFGDERKRRVMIEGELWNTDTVEVVWRVNSVVVSRSERVTDEFVVKSALQEIYRAIPEVPFARQYKPDW